MLYDRIKHFEKTRQTIVKDLLDSGIMIDFSVTTDPWRVLRVSGSLHGETGRIAMKVEDLAHFDLRASDAREPRK